MQIDELQTPCVLINRRRLEANIRAMQARASANDVALRPHIKTHKSPSIAKRQLAAGAIGITVATPGEAEIFADAGFDDIRIAYTVAGAAALRRVAALGERIRLSLCVDTLDGAAAVAEAFASNPAPADVLVEVDTGHHRTGVAWDGLEALQMVQFVRDQPSLRFVGLLTHAGQAYSGPGRGESPQAALKRYADEERDRICSLAARLAADGLVSRADTFELSIGSTPTMAAFTNTMVEGWRITEIRPGNYVFNDAMQLALGSATADDCALTVVASVVSKHRDEDGSERIFIDAGKKILTADTGFGTTGYGVLLYNPRTMTPLPHATIASLSEEHGWVRVRGGSTLSVGDTIRLIPNHACVVAATQSVLYLTDDDEVFERLPVGRQ